MVETEKGNGTLEKLIVRICPACGVVNPSGPSESCPHLQLVRFEGIDETLEALLGRVATVRNKYAELITELRGHVMQAARSGQAEVVATQKGRVSQMPTSGRKAKPLSLTHPEPPKSKVKSKPKPKKSTAVNAVDPRQLDLISREPSQGDA